MYDLSKIFLNKITILSEYYEKFNENNIEFLSEIIDWDVSAISKIFNFNFLDSCKLMTKIKNVNEYLTNEKFEEIYLDKVEKENTEKVEFNIYEFIPIIKLNLSNHTFRSLMSYSITNFSSLLNVDREWLESKRGFGEKSINEILNTTERLKLGFFDKIVNDFSLNNPYLKKTNLTIDKLKLTDSTYNDLDKNFLKNLDDIINFSTEDFSNIPQFGKKSISEICPILDQLKENLKLEDKDYLTNCLKEINENINNYLYKDLSLYNFDLSMIGYDTLLKIGLTENSSFIEFNNAIIDSFQLNIFTINELKQLVLFFKDYTEIKELKIESYFSSRSIDVLSKRNNRYTLESIAQLYGLTRERIRQIENKATEELNDFINKNNIDKYLLNNIFEEDSETVLDNYTYKMIFPILDIVINAKKIVKNDKYYFINKKYYERYGNIIRKLINEIEMNGFVFFNDFNLGDIDSYILEDLLKEFNIEKGKNTYYLKSSRIDKIISYIKRFGQIDLSIENYDSTVKKLEEYLNIKDFKKRNFVSKIARYDIVSDGESRYFLKSQIPKIDDFVLEQIAQMIFTEKSISCKDLIYKFKDKLPLNIPDSLLYFELKEKFNDEFNFGGANLRISIKGVSTSIASSVYNYVLNNGEPTLLVDILNKFKINKTSFSVVREQNSDIFQIDDVNVWAFSKMPDLNMILNNMKSYICGKQSFYVSDFYRYFKDKHKDVLIINKITSLERFHNLLKVKLKSEIAQYEYDRIKKMYFKKENNINIGFDFDF